MYCRNIVADLAALTFTAGVIEVRKQTKKGAAIWQLPFLLS
jgi:hypothetical protein